MFPAPLFLGLLIIATPVILIFDGPIIHGLVTAAAAVLVVIVGLRIRPGEAGFLSSVIRPMIIFTSIPAVWMVVQVLPLQVPGLTHPIWQSAAAALERPLSGSISVDPGATILALAQYLSVIAIAFVAAAVATNRHRAEEILFTLTTAVTLIALMVIAADFGNLAFLSKSVASVPENSVIDAVALGVILAAAAALHSFELSNLQRTDKDQTSWYTLTFVACLVALAICSWFVVVRATSSTYFAVICGIATLVVSVAIRGFRFGPWGLSAVLSVATISTIAFVALQPDNRPLGLTLAFATRAPPPLIAVTQRILTETSLAGTGAGTYAAVLPIYRGVDELVAGPIAPTAMSAIAVEMGQPFLWTFLTATAALVATLLRGAVRRRRDSLYSTAGASFVVTITLLAFGNAAVLSTSVLIITAAVIGTAIAQSKSRSV